MADVYWRDTQRPLRFFIFDAKAALAILLFLFHAKLWTFITSIVLMFLFWGMERKGLTFTTALRKVRGFIIGKKRPRLAKLEKVKFKDYG
jgi:hypothetical protein